ncbi:MAG: PhpK family radical SAM P-methyltransferase [Nitrospinae bacterium]|nr:PhpK family radical SAM P-methyltransferase [Nitrospinota bacterium]
MTDCLIIGFNDFDFREQVEMTRSMDGASGAHRDLKLAYINHNGVPKRALDIFSEFHGGQRFHNQDFLAPSIVHLGTYLAKKGFSFDYVNLFQQGKETLRRKLESGDALTVAVTTTFYVSAPPVMEVISFVRSVAPKVKIIVGGPFIAGQQNGGGPEAMREFFTYLGADVYVISQEGEAALANVIGAIKSGSPLSGVDNIAYLDGDGHTTTRIAPENNPLGDNTPDYSLFKKDDIGQFVSLRTAKSCPFSCAFCGFPRRAGKYSYIGPDEVEKALDSIREIGGVSTLTILDDTFNVPKKRFKEILRMMIRKNHGFRWNSFYRSDYGDEETAELMRRAGCEGVFMGAESGSDAMLEKMNKTSRRKDYLDAIRLMKNAGIVTHVALIIGFPGETRDTARETADFIEEAGPDFFRAQLWYCDPVTPVWEKRRELGITGSAFNWAHATMDSREAADIVEKMFLTVENSAWTPQNNFELWSVFYLMRHGMNLNQVKTFVRCFNNVIKEELIRGADVEDADPLMENLRRACRFGGTQPDLELIEAYSGARIAVRLESPGGGAVEEDAKQSFNF